MNSHSAPGVRLGVLLLAWITVGCPQEVPKPGPDAVEPADDSPHTVQAGTGVWTMDAPTSVTAYDGRARCPQCNVVVITMCSVRRDHVGVYADNGRTPNLDRIADGGFHFDQAIAASNFTLASLTAILTGRFGASTGVVGWDKGLTTSVPTLPEVMGIYGYTTGAFTVDAASGFRPDYGLNRGFQHMEIIRAPSDNPDGRRATGPTGKGLAAQPFSRWLAQQPAEKPVFAMFHTRTAHFPFVVAPPDGESDSTGIGRLLWGDDLNQDAINDGGGRPGVAGGTRVQGVGVSADPNRLQNAVWAAGPAGLAAWREYYMGGIERLDADIGAVFDALAASGRLDRTIVLAVADHGESLGDHAELLHGDSYFDPVIRVPLLLKVPDLPGHAEPIRSLVSHVDILPTLLELVGAVLPADADGHSMVPILVDPEVQIRGTALSEGGVSWTPRDVLRGAVISPPWAMLRQPLGCSPPGVVEPPPKQGEPFTCLFDTVMDPKQTNNLAAQRPDVVEALVARWDGFRAMRAGKDVAESLRLDPGFVELLKKSGYFQAVPPDNPR